MKTEFLSPSEKGKILESLKGVRPDVIEKIYDEFDRLENRIKNLELGISVVLDKYEKDTNLTPQTHQ